MVHRGNFLKRIAYRDEISLSPRCAKFCSIAVITDSLIGLGHFQFSILKKPEQSLDCWQNVFNSKYSYSFDNPRTYILDSPFMCDQSTVGLLYCLYLRNQSLRPNLILSNSKNFSKDFPQYLYILNHCRERLNKIF